MRRELGFMVAGAIVLTTRAAIAQSVIVPDDTLGVERSVVSPTVIQNLPSDRIDGGATRGGNLFHSFAQFNVDAGRGVYFASPAGIVNILSRVTGTGRSDILGRLGVLGNANLFLLNPNGMVFGPNASLDVGGSFVATTASAIGFGDRGSFSTTNPSAPSELLTINPSVFLFDAIANQDSPGIVVRSNAANALGGNGLQVPDGQKLLLLGGNVTVDGGELNAWGGRVDLGAVSGAGIVALNTDGGLQFSDRVARGDVLLRNNATVDVMAEDRGSVSITARNVEVVNGSLISAGIFSSLGSEASQAGDVTLNATESIKISGDSAIGNSVQSDSLGTGGNINITAKSLLLSDIGQLSASIFGQGNAGRIVIKVDDLVSLVGINDPTGLETGIFSTVHAGAVGNGGEISIHAGSFSLTNGAQLLTVVRGASNELPSGRGNSGNITITIRENATVSGVSTRIASAIDTGATGKAGDISINASNLSISEGALVKSTLDSGANGMAGDIAVRVKSLSMSNNASLDTFTSGQGNAGNISVWATDTVSLTEDAAMQSGVERGGIGNGGNINIESGGLFLSKGGQLITALRESDDGLSAGQGTAGNVNINISGDIVIDGISDTLSSAILSAVRPEAIGKGGNINIQASSLFLTNGGSIDSSTFGEGDAGDISINLRSALQAKSGLITTESDQFSSGNITVNARNILGLSFRLCRVDIKMPAD